DPPSDIVISARGVAAYPDAPNYPVTCIIQREPTAEHVHSADSFAFERIIRGSEIGSWSLISVCGIDWVAVLQSEQAAARLDCGVEIRRGKGKPSGRTRPAAGSSPVQAECVGGVRLLGRYNPASQPLSAAAGTGKCDRANDSIAIHDGCPHVEVQSASL